MQRLQEDLINAKRRFDASGRPLTQAEANRIHWCATQGKAQVTTRRSALIWIGIAAATVIAIRRSTRAPIHPAE